MSKVILKDKTGNQINVIYPYRTKSGWAFDDEEVGLQGEPFVMGIPEIIDGIVGGKDTFTAYISKDPIPFFTAFLQKVTDVPQKYLPNGEGWYELNGSGLVGWLCPATLKYFKEYPETIYFKIE